MGVKIGIDLGTTYSAVARIDASTGKPVIVKNCFDANTTPSALCFKENGEILFGEEAKDEYNAGNPNAAAFYKRNMGDSTFSLNLVGQSYSAADLSAIFLEKLIEDVEAQLSTTVDGAVITVPAYFGHKQVEATIAAAQQAGITLLSTVHEPTASAFAYGLEKADQEQTVLFYDLGGGTFDVTIAKISSKGIEVLGSDGDHRLGGKDWDDAITRYLIHYLREEYDIDASGDDGLKSTIQGKSEQIKKQLSAKQQVDVPLFVNGQRISLCITAATFADISESLCERTFDIIENLFYELGLSWQQIDSIILIGGSTKMPSLKSYLTSKTDTPVEAGVNVDEAVALGAAIKANVNDENSNLTPGSDKPLLSGFTVSDVVAHSLGMIATNLDGDAYINSRIIPKNSKIPADKTVAHKFKASARTTEMEIYVLQGEEDRPLDNTVINKYVAMDITANHKDGENIDVTYSYDRDGLIVVVAAQDGRKLPIRIESVPEDMSWTDRPPSATDKITALMAIDVSGSMGGNPLEEAKKAMLVFVDDFEGSGAEIGVMVFDDSERVLCRPTESYEQLRSIIRGISVGGGTSTDPLGQAMLLPEDGFLVILTDGAWFNPGTALNRRASLLKAKPDLTIFALGFGTADEAFLRKIATSSDLDVMTDVSKLRDSFGKIAQVIQSGSSSIALR